MRLTLAIAAKKQTWDDYVQHFLDIGLTKSDADNFFQHTYSGIVGRNSTRNTMERIARIVPKKYRDLPPKTVYRGIVLPKRAKKQLDAGKHLSLKPKVMTSFTADRNEAAGYASNIDESTEVGAVLHFKPKPKDIVLYIGPKLQKYLNVKYGDFKNSYGTVANKAEVLIKGTGPEYLDKSNTTLVK